MHDIDLIILVCAGLTVASVPDQRDRLQGRRALAAPVPRHRPGRGRERDRRHRLQRRAASLSDSAPPNIRCSNRCAKPVLPGRSFFEPT